MVKSSLPVAFTFLTVYNVLDPAFWFSQGTPGQFTDVQGAPSCVLRIPTRHGSLAAIKGH